MWFSVGRGWVCVSVWGWGCESVCVCACVAVWLCGCVAVCLCVCVTVWLCGCVVAVWLCAPRAWGVHAAWGISMLMPMFSLPSRHELDPERARQLISEHFVALKQFGATS